MMLVMLPFGVHGRWSWDEGWGHYHRIDKIKTIDFFCSSNERLV